MTIVSLVIFLFGVFCDEKAHLCSKRKLLRGVVLFLTAMNRELCGNFANILAGKSLPIQLTKRLSNALEFREAED